MRLGVLDIGSNTVHLLLVDAHPGGRPVPFASHKKPLQLVAYLDERGSISREGQDELVGFVQEARAFADRHDAEDFLAFCTSAIREAGNGREVLARVRAETGVDLQELSGDQEAFRDLVLSMGFAWALVRSIDDALAGLKAAGIPTRLSEGRP